MSDRPVKLTFPATEPGYVRILADGIQVGYALTVWDERDTRNGRWEAHLWSVAGVHEVRGATVACLRLRDLRAEVRQFVAWGGPWWVAGHPDGLES